MSFNRSNFTSTVERSQNNCTLEPNYTVPHINVPIVSINQIVKCVCHDINRFSVAPKGDCTTRIVLVKFFCTLTLLTPFWTASKWIFYILLLLRVFLSQHRQWQDFLFTIISNCLLGQVTIHFTWNFLFIPQLREQKIPGEVYGNLEFSVHPPVKRTEHFN